MGSRKYSSVNIIAAIQAGRYRPEWNLNDAWASECNAEVDIRNI